MTMFQRVLRVLWRVGVLSASAFALGGGLYAQTCVFNASGIPVHAEGLAEKVADVTVSCSGGTAGANVSLTMFVSLNTPITNRVDDNGAPLGITFSGAASGSFRLSSPTTLTFNAVNYTVPVVPSAPVVLTISGIRAAPSSLGAGTARVFASVAGVGAIFTNGAQVLLANGTPSLLSSAIMSGVPCNGSPLPGTQDFAGFTAVTNASTIRVTEAIATALAEKKTGDDSGTRIVVRLTGYGTGARVFVPDAIVGNSGTQATSVGAFSSTVSGGVYTPGASQLLMALVSGSNANGGGGAPSFGLPAALTSFTTLTELTLTDGAAQAVYEVLDANAAVQESAHIPVFVVVPSSNCPSALTPSLSATLGPVSTVDTGTKSDPIPRFVAVTLASDCSVLNDCNAPYFPKLSVDQTPITLTGTSLGDKKSAFIRVGNSGSGILPFTTSIEYGSGSGWLSLSPSAGANNVNVEVIADAGKLAQGIYTATVTVAAGVYGSGTIPVTFEVGPVGVVVQAVGNAASFEYGTVAPGSYAVLFGLNMGGTNVSATFNGIQAQLIYKSATQLNLIVPSALAGQQAAAVVVTVDNQVSNSFKVNLAPNAVGVFTPGIVNFTGGQVNTVTNPAVRGDIALVFLTGLADPVAGQVTVSFGSQSGVVPSYAGPQGTLPALSQVNVTIPASLPASPNPVKLQVCVPNTVGQRVCSNAVDLYIR